MAVDELFIEDEVIDTYFIQSILHGLGYNIMEHLKNKVQQPAEVGMYKKSLYEVVKIRELALVDYQYVATLPEKDNCEIGGTGARGGRRTIYDDMDAQLDMLVLEKNGTETIVDGEVQAGGYDDRDVTDTSKPADREYKAEERDKKRVDDPD